MRHTTTMEALGDDFVSDSAGAAAPLDLGESPSAPFGQDGTLMPHAQIGGGDSRADNLTVRARSHRTAHCGAFTGSFSADAGATQQRSQESAEQLAETKEKAAKELADFYAERNAKIEARAKANRYDTRVHAQIATLASTSRYCPCMRESKLTTRTAWVQGGRKRERADPRFGQVRLGGRGRHDRA